MLNKLVKVLITLSLVALASCSLKEVDEQSNSPLNLGGDYSTNSLDLVDKRFFGLHINGNSIQYEDKTFACGWAPIDQAGKYGKGGYVLYGANSARHCNIKWEVTENKLIGRMVDFDDLLNLQTNNDYNTSTRSAKNLINLKQYLDMVQNWEQVVEIPITGHYFYEEARNGYGQELTGTQGKQVRNVDWAVRPFMTLNFSGMKITKASKRLLFSEVIQNVKDVVMCSYGYESKLPNDIQKRINDNLDSSCNDPRNIKKSKNYLAFSVNARDGYVGSDLSATFRINFMEIEVNKKGFQKIPHNKQNAKHINVLHSTGGRSFDKNEVIYAGHWDVSEPVPFYLWGYKDKRYIEAAEEVIAEFNEKFKSNGVADKAFELVKKDSEAGSFLKYPFDLRYPTFIFVEDRELSMRAPLGIGLTSMDFMTGRFVWGSAILWGGMIDYLISREAPGAGLDSMINALSGNHVDQIDLKHDIEKGGLINSMKPMSIRQDISDAVAVLMEGLNNTKDQNITESSSEKDKFAALENSLLEEFKKGLDINTLIDSSLEVDSPNSTNSQTFIDQLLLSAGYSSEEKGDLLSNKPNLSKLINSKSMSKELINGALQEHVEENLYNLSVDMDRTFGDVYAGWRNGFGIASSKGGNFDRSDASKSVIKNILMHELGHVVGFGHQFVGSVLPEYGTLPDSTYKELLHEAKEGFNYTSIMDYMSGEAEVLIPSHKVKLKIHDEHMIRFLYKKEYPVYKTGDVDYKYVELNENGLIPNNPSINLYEEGYRIGYLPACSDFEALFAENPYCVRWDKGSMPHEIVKENHLEFTETIMKRLYKLTPLSNVSASRASAYLYRKLDMVLTRSRNFYDYMRYKLEIKNNDDDQFYGQIFSELKSSQDALYVFSEACIEPDKADKKYQFLYSSLAFERVASCARKVRKGTPSPYDCSPVDGVSTNDYSELRTALETIAQEELDAFTNAREKAYEKGYSLEELFDLLKYSFIDKKESFLPKSNPLSEIHSLCRANLLNINNIENLIKIKGNDKSEIDWDNRVVPTGLSAGNLNKMKNTYWQGTLTQQGLLPLRYLSLKTLTDVAPYQRLGRWSIPVPKYFDTKYSYATLYPNEFLGTLRSSISNNIESAQENGTGSRLGITNLLLSYLIDNSIKNTNDTTVKGFDKQYLESIKEQLKGGILRAVPIIITPHEEKGAPTGKVFKFNARVRLGRNESIDLPNFNILPNGEVFPQGITNQLLIPITKLKFASNKLAFVWAYEVNYSNSPLSKFKGVTVKSLFGEKTLQEIQFCLNSEDGQGLNSFFKYIEDGQDNPDVFHGFDISEEIHISDVALLEFEKSVENEFKKYSNISGINKNGAERCLQALDGLKLIFSSLAAVQGQIVPFALDYVEK